jgi:hypothetical protein
MRRRRRSVCLRQRKDLTSWGNPAGRPSIASVLGARRPWRSQARSGYCGWTEVVGPFSRAQSLRSNRRGPKGRAFRPHDARRICENLRVS